MKDKIKSSDKKIKINTKTNLIEGVDENNKITGSVYNKYIEKGNFFKIPVGESELHTTAGIAKEEITKFKLCKFNKSSFEKFGNEFFKNIFLNCSFFKKNLCEIASYN